MNVRWIIDDEPAPGSTRLPIEYCIIHWTPRFIGPQCLAYLQLTARARRVKFLPSGTSILYPRHFTSNAHAQSFEARGRSLCA